MHQIICDNCNKIFEETTLNLMSWYRIELTNLMNDNQIFLSEEVKKLPTLPYCGINLYFCPECMKLKFKVVK